MDHFSTFSKLWSQMLRKWLKQAKKLFYTCVLELNMQLSTAWDNQVVKIVVSSYAVNHTLYLAILYAHCASIRVKQMHWIFLLHKVSFQRIQTSCFVLLLWNLCSLLTTEYWNKENKLWQFSLLFSCLQSQQHCAYRDKWNLIFKDKKAVEPQR